MGSRALGLAAAVLVLGGCSPTTSSGDAGVDSLFSDADDLRVVATCLADRGWDARLQDGAILVDVPEAQRSAYEQDSAECWQEAGINVNAGPSEADYESIYGWYSDIDDCLSRAGFPTPQKPSFEVFRSTYDTDPWIPWSEVPDASQAASTCPIMNVPNR